MNIIRTKAVELTAIPAIAYKQKLASGGAGIKLIRLDQEAAAVATLDKRSGDLIPYGSYNEDLFPLEAFDEANDLAAGLPYSARGKIRITVSEQAEAEDINADETDPAQEKNSMVTSDEYNAIVDRYSDENGKMNFSLLNKDFIQFASKSKTVSDMIGNYASVEEIVLFIVKSRAALIAGKKESLDDASIAALIDTLNEINPRSTFKELRSYIIRLLAKNKKRG